MNNKAHSIVEKFKKNPQLAYTLFVAAVIAVGFFFVVNRFALIAQDAEERLQQVRIGSIQDVFVSLIPKDRLDPLFLSLKINEITRLNETLQAFDVVTKNETGEYVVLASNNEESIGLTYPHTSISFSLAEASPESSFSTPHIKNGNRFFRTVRAITDSTGTVLGLTVAEQSLSEADKQIERAIRDGMYLFVIILLGIMFLFLRHAKIVDYVTLYKRLKEVDTLKDDFISMASHELRTPLTAIRGYAEFLSESKKISEKEREYIHAIDTSAQRLDLLVSDMLDVSRIEQGRMSFNFEEIVPEDIVSEVIESLQQNAKKKNIELSYQVKESGVLRVDETRLRQVLVNIIGNSIKYTRKGSVSVALYVDHDQQVIHVSDTGIGMNAEALSHLFEKFYRVKNKFTSDVVGTGLGLWITKQIVEHMHGTISVESIEGVGTHIKIKFPIYRK